MTSQKRPTNILIVCDDPARAQNLSECITQQLPQTKVLRCSSLRLNSPDIPRNNIGAIVLFWENNTLRDWRDILLQDTPTRRSYEGIVCDIANNWGESMLRRTAVFANKLSHEEVIFLSEFKIRCVQTASHNTSDKTSAEFSFARKLSKLIHDEEIGGASLADQALRRFELSIGRWSRLDEFQKMYICDNLRRYFGNTAAFDELMARKALAENDPGKAESLLRQSLVKNHLYLPSQQMLAEMYLKQGRVAEALDLYLSMQQISPRHPGRAQKIAECYMKLGRIKEADNACADAFRIDEYAARSRENLAITKLALGDYNSAKSILNGFCNDREMAAYLNSLGIQLVKAGKFPESIEHYTKALVIMKTNSHRHVLFLNTAIAYAKWGKPAQAKQYAHMALAHVPGFPKAVQLLNSLGADPMQIAG